MRRAIAVRPAPRSCAVRAPATPQLHQHVLRAPHQLAHPFKVAPLIAPTVALRAQHTQAQRKERVVDAKLGEVVPKSHHQATTEERLRMSCSHDEAKHRFSLRCDAAHPVVAVLDYDVVKPGFWDLKYTQVSPEFQHHGVADEIVIRALEFAKANNYISDTFMARHPEWSDIRADGEKEGGKAVTSRKAPERLQYDERMKKENNAADPKFTKTKQETRKSGNAEESRSASSQTVAENAKSSESMDKAKAEEQPATAARELNEAMKKNNERGFRGYA